MHQTARMLQQLEPDTEGLSTTDPLLGAKYAFEHPVDLLIAGLQMKRMSGLQIAGFLREKSPEAEICLFAEPREWNKSLRLDQRCHPLLLPVKKENLRKILEECRK